MTNRVWKDGTRRGIAYVEGREAAQQVLEIAGRQTPAAAGTRRVSNAEAEMGGAMAIYSDPKGRPFAWQIPFDIGCWDRISALVNGAE
jgi:hypothetical protein